MHADACNAKCPQRRPPDVQAFYEGQPITIKLVKMGEKPNMDELRPSKRYTRIIFSCESCKAKEPINI